MRRLSRIGQAVWIFALVNCPGPEAEEPIDRLLARPFTEQGAYLSSLDPEQQVVLCLLARGRQHPPNSDLDRVVVQQGGRTLPYLLAALAESSERTVKLDALRLIALMQEEEYYCVTCDAAALETVKREVRGLGSSTWVDYFLEHLERSEFKQ